jgi:hypothetical protein
VKEQVAEIVGIDPEQVTELEPNEIWQEAEESSDIETKTLNWTPTREAGIGAIAIEEEGKQWFPTLLPKVWAE